jgi:hypothetical protein
MSSLRELIDALESVNRDADRFAQQLAGQARLLQTAAARAAAVAQHTARPEGTAAAIALQTAHRAVSEAAQHLHRAAIAGRGFIARHVAGAASPARAADGSSESASDSASIGGRYLLPGVAVDARFQQLVSRFGPADPAGWIAAGNPHYATDLPAWTNNCGSCSRSFADTFQGVSVRAALGDADIPPGEYEEMWDALGARPSSRMTNRHAEPASFTVSAFQALEASLLREGPGAVAIIGVDWDRPGFLRGNAGGHWFNAYVDRAGIVRWADEQSGRTSGWPPDYAVGIWQIEAVVRPASGVPWKELVL